MALSELNMAAGYEVLDSSGLHNISEYAIILAPGTSDADNSTLLRHYDVTSDADRVSGTAEWFDTFSPELQAKNLTNSTSKLLDTYHWESFYNSSVWPDLNATNEDRDLPGSIVKGLFLGALITMTISGNVLVLLAVFVNAHLRSTTHYFIANLAVADLLLGTTVLPFSASLEVIDRWVFGQLFCEIWAAVDVLCCTASIMGLCVISIDRYIGVTRPLQHSTIMTEKRASLIIVLVWVLSIAISVAPLLGWKDKPPDNPDICEVTKQLGYVLFSVSGSFYIPLMIILVVYFRVYREALNQSRFLKTGVKTSKGDEANNDVTLRIHMGGKASKVNPQNKGNAYQSSSSSEQSQESGRKYHTKFTLAGKIAKFKREKKAAKTLGIVVGVFILCWFPFFFVLPLEALCSACYIPGWLFKFIFWLGYCNSMMNPIIYAMSSKEFKRAFIRILKCQWRRRPRNFIQGVYHPNSLLVNHHYNSHNRRTPKTIFGGFTKRFRNLRRSRRKCLIKDKRESVTLSMAAILYTSQVSQSRRFETESPLTSLKQLQDRRKETIDTIIISDDESGAIHEESDIDDDDDECACSEDHESIQSGSMHSSPERYRCVGDPDRIESEPDASDNLLETASNYTEMQDCDIAHGECAELHCLEGAEEQTNHRSETHRRIIQPNSELIIHDLERDKLNNTLSVGPTCLNSTNASGHTDKCEQKHNYDRIDERQSLLGDISHNNHEAASGRTIGGTNNNQAALGGMTIGGIALNNDHETENIMWL